MKRFLILSIVLLSFSKAFPQQVSNALNSGKDEFAKGNFNSALEKFEAVIKADPKTKDVYFFAGLSEYNLKNYSKAISYFTRDIKNNKKDPRSYLYRAKAKQGSFHSALRDLKKAQKLGMEKFTVYNETAGLCFENKKYKKALTYFSKLLDLRSGTDDTYYKMGLCSYYLKDENSAAGYWNKISDPDDFEQFDLIQKICKK